MSSDMKKFLVDYYKTILAFYGTYQNHKQLTAWAGLVLHVFFCGLMTRIEMPEEFIYAGSICLIAFTLITTYFFYLYINNQLLMKRSAAAFGAAAQFLVCEIIQMDENSPDLVGYIKIEESTDTMSQAQHVSPTKLRNKAEIIRTRGAGRQFMSEILIYFLLFFSSAVIIFTVVLKSSWI